ncbi:7TM diverse intracellular signaling domain-containing protein [Pedobacter sp. SAFR-022]|uniref:7TM diverse intracellular signaling domain-containing protein n=1 Tax=Pedobacter sp. SAFR-022 TaxID=3436861 RepID=UPI003F7DB58C
MIQIDLKHCREGFLFLFLIILACSPAAAQTPVVIRDDVNQHIFTYKEIEMLEDPSGSLGIDQIRRADHEGRFKASTASTPQTLNLSSNYWFKIKIKSNPAAEKHYLLEFFDQTIDAITVYMPEPAGGYRETVLGDQYPFVERRLKHKNFEIPIENSGQEINTYYIKIRSTQIADAIVVLRSVDFFIAYALNEYLFFGVFYGMILVFSLYNLVLFISMKQREYLYYVLYILSVGVYEMSTDGIAYQYLWPNHPEFNQIAYAVALCSTSVFALLFTRQLLHLNVKAPKINRIIIAAVGLRLLFFLYCLLFDHALFSFKFLEVVPLSLAFFAGIYVYLKGYQAARFFVLGYSVLFIGFSLKFLIMLGYGWLNFGVVSYYSLSFSFVAEMVLFSFAIADQLRLLKDKINRELESKVAARTQEVSHKSLIIEAKNAELEEMNTLLKKQAEDISRMNVLLEMDNQALNTNVEKVTRARVMSAEMDFEEFSRIYPDKETCYQFLADLKWKNGYACRKCKQTQFYTGHAPYSRRCSKCGYEESVTSYSIFHNTRIPINKAFYMVYLIYTTKGKTSSHKISEVLNMRQSTCWTYSSRVKTAMEEKKTILKRSGKQGWSQLILD